MAIYLTGDLHGTIDIRKLSNKYGLDMKNLTKSDVVIILGDFGLLWTNPMTNEEKYWLQWLEDKPFTTLFVDGNHENFDLLNSYPVEAWQGGKVHRISDSILHLMRGQVFEIYGKKFFTFGGGLSIDKGARKEGKSWWPQEMPSEEEYAEALENLQKHDFEVHYVLTHTCSAKLLPEVIQYCYYHDKGTADDLNLFLDRIENEVQFKHWYFGHMHYNKTFKDRKHTVLYNRVHKLL